MLNMWFEMIGIHQPAKLTAAVNGLSYCLISSLFEPVITLNSLLSAASAGLVHAAVKVDY